MLWLGESVRHHLRYVKVHEVNCPFCDMILDEVIFNGKVLGPAAHQCV
jgi:hypothetical protein